MTRKFLTRKSGWSVLRGAFVQHHGGCVRDVEAALGGGKVGIMFYNKTTEKKRQSAIPRHSMIWYILPTWKVNFYSKCVGKYTNVVPWIRHGYRKFIQQKIEIFYKRFWYWHPNIHHIWYLWYISPPKNERLANSLPAVEIIPIFPGKLPIKITGGNLSSKLLCCNVDPGVYVCFKIQDPCLEDHPS